jgi:hypothetical protein
MPRIGGLTDAALVLFCLAWIVWRVSAWGRRTRLRANARYVRETRFGGLPPAFVGYFWRDGVTRSVDVAATLLDLIDRGVVTLRPVNGSYLLTRHDAPLPDDSRRDARGRVRKHERLVMALVFDVLGEGAGTVDTRAIRRAAQQSSDVVMLGFAAFCRIVDQRACQTVGEIRLSSTGEEIRNALPGALAAAGSLALWAVFGAPMCVIGVIAGAVMAAATLLIRVPHATRLQLRAEGLRQYLQDFGRFQGRPPEAVALWSGFMPYAVIFGLDELAGDALWAPSLFDITESELLDPEWWNCVNLEVDEVPEPVRRIIGWGLLPNRVY